MTILDYPEETQPRTKTEYTIIVQSFTSGLADLLAGPAIAFLGWLIGIMPIAWFGFALGVLMVATRVFNPETVYRCSSIADAYDVLDMLDEEDEGEL